MANHVHTSMSNEHEDFPTETPAVVTVGLPYANGDLHIGHLRGYVSGDVFARALRTLGQRTAFVCGSDMHGTPIAVSAQQENVSPEEFALRWHETYEETFPEFNVVFDNYGHTHDETNTELTREIVRELDERGYVYETEIEVAWDTKVDQSLPDRYVEGKCPYCGGRARGDECLEEGRHLQPGEVENPTSVLTGNPAEYRMREHKFFELSAFREYLRDFLDRLEGTANARNQPREWIEGELRDWCITRDMDWGIEYPGEDTNDLVLYVWVDAPIEYVASTKQYAERVGPEAFDWSGAWQEGAGEIVHVIGRDIIQHHTVFWPAMLHGVEYTEPRAVLAHGYVNLNDRGFSTSENRAVWADEYVNEGFDPDLLRYYLATGSGFQQDIDFSWDRFQQRVNGELVGTLGNFLYRSLLFAHRTYDGTPDADLSAEVQARIEGAIDDFGAGANDYSVRAISQSPIELAQFGNEYIQQNEPWTLVEDDPERATQVIRDCVQLAKAIAVLSAPVLPGKAERLWAQLGEPDAAHEATLDTALEAPPETFDAPTELFERIEDDHVARLNEELEARIEDAGEADDAEDESRTGDSEGADVTAAAERADTETNGKDTSIALEPLADDRIGFEEFQDIDVRVGRIETATPIEGSDDLIRLDVDIGLETRQVVAGIKQLHDVASLSGTKVVVVANMEKAELFGVESNGMVLAAGEEADLLTTHGDAPPGTKVR